jgi:beta-ring hydroxylase
MQDFVMGKGLIPADGEIWKARRRAIVPALHKKYVASMVGMFSDCTLNGTRTLDEVRVEGQVAWVDPPVIRIPALHFTAGTNAPAQPTPLLNGQVIGSSGAGLLANLLHTVLQAVAKGKPIDMENFFSRFALDIIGKAVFNYDFDSLTHDDPIIQVGRARAYCADCAVPKLFLQEHLS